MTIPEEAVTAADIERILTRRIFEGRLDGYTLETSKEIAALTAAAPRMGGEVERLPPNRDLITDLKFTARRLRDLLTKARAEIDKLKAQLAEKQEVASAVYEGAREELEALRAQLAERTAERDEARAQIKVKDEALEFYGRRENFIARTGMDSPISRDNFGDRARAARSGE